MTEPNETAQQTVRKRSRGRSALVLFGKILAIVGAVVSIIVGLAEIGDRLDAEAQREKAKAELDAEAARIRAQAEIASNERAARMAECSGKLSSEQVQFVFDLVKDNRASPEQAQSLILTATCALVDQTSTPENDTSIVLNNAIRDDAFDLTQSPYPEVRSAIADVLVSEYSDESLERLETVVALRAGRERLPYEFLEQGGPDRGEAPPEYTTAVDAAMVIVVVRQTRGQPFPAGFRGATG